MLELLLMASLGFLGSFGHCLGMCGPLTVAFSLTDTPAAWSEQLRFNLLLNLGRLLSYALVGSALGAIGSVLLAGGQLAGIGSGLRQGFAIGTGLLLIWSGLHHIDPQGLPPVPGLYGLLGHLHARLPQAMQQVDRRTPLLLGLLWGLMPCGFLYAAQLQAAATSTPLQGGLTMLAFGLGTVPIMVGVGVSTAWLSRDQRSQLFRLGGGVTVIIGLLTLARSSEMVDYTGHGALLLLILTLIARPISRYWSGLLRYRRALGVGAFILSLVHLTYMMEHTFVWNLAGLGFMLPLQQWGLWAGLAAILCMLPAALTSTDGMVQRLGKAWYTIHRLAVPAFLLAVVHAILNGSSYLGGVSLTPRQAWYTVGLSGVVVVVFLLRSRWVGPWCGGGYGAAQK
jgi:hypothetical protein